MTTSSEKKKKSGFVVLVGRSNVGKSTLINALVGSKIAITTPKPQTTRLPIHGILTRDEGQIVFVDTPGVLKGAKDHLSKMLSSSIKSSLNEVDAILYVVDPTRSIGDEEKASLHAIEHIDVPKFLIINKMDSVKKPYLDFYRDLRENFDDVIEISASMGTHVKTIILKLFAVLPEGEPFYPEFQITNTPTKDWVAELIREKLFLRLRQEVPYSVHVEVTAMEERENGMLYIAATVFTTDDRYKRMIIGTKGHGIKEIGQSTRRELETVMNKKIFLDLIVEKDPHWMMKFE